MSFNPFPFSEFAAVLAELVVGWIGLELLTLVILDSGLGCGFASIWQCQLGGKVLAAQFVS